MALTNPSDQRELRIPEWTLGDRLAKARTEAGMEQEDMARILNVSKSSISAWERDESQPRKLFSVIATWAAETGVPRGWLLGEQDLQRSRCSSEIDLRIIPGGGKTHEVTGQTRLPFLTLI